MLIELTQVWQEGIFPGLKVHKEQTTDPASKAPDDKFVQFSFAFTTPPRVVFVASEDNLIPVSRYSDLPALLTPGENYLVHRVSMEAMGNKKFYNGDHFLIRKMLYDPDKNEIYLVAYRIKYALFLAIQQKRFPSYSRLYNLVNECYKVGVIAPVISSDDCTFLMQRGDPYKLYSAPAGFVEPPKDGIIHFATGSDLIVQTALTELIEELIGIYRASDAGRVLTLAFPVELPAIKSVSMRRLVGGVSGPGTIEFVAPCFAHACHERVVGYIRDNRADHADEHTGKVMVVRLDSHSRDEMSKQVATVPGKFLTHPIVLAAAAALEANLQMRLAASKMFPAHLGASQMQTPVIPYWWHGISRLAILSKEEQTRLRTIMAT